MASLTKGLRLPFGACICLVLPVFFALLIGITGDVPDDVVHTDIQRTVQLGDRAILKCQFYGTPLAVFWKKGSDPTTAPNLITWVEGENDSGSCVHDKTCKMNGDYSLIIKNVTLADQGRYICRVSNYKGYLIHGYTDFKVYATPEEPYPFINECTENGNNCTVSAQSPLNITCTASRYFPIIDLLFLNGGQKVSTIETVEWENDDGTKSKLIFTRVPPSKTPYVCMAFNIPGSQDERTSTISVFDHHANTTFGEPTETDLTRIFKIGFSVALSIVAGIGVCILVVGLVKILCKKCWERERKISYYELWFLAGKMTESQANQSKLRDTFKYLKFTAVIREGQLTQLEAYQALCQWKEENTEIDQPKDLKEASVKFRFGDVWIKMMDERGVSQETMEHILWTLGDIEKVNQFLRQLIPDREPINANEKMVFVVEVAVKALDKMINKSTQINPFVPISLALEDAGCTRMDRLLFSVPEKLMAPIQVKELRVFTDKLTGRHCKRLAMTMKISKQKIDDSVVGNNQYLLDTRALITEMECSNYEKRCRLDDAINTIGRYDLHDFFETHVHRQNAEDPRVKSHYFDHESIFDDDIPQLVKLVEWLPPDKKTQLKIKMGLPDQKGNDEDTLKDQMKAWRDSITTISSDKVSIDQSLKKFQSFRKELTNNTKYTELTLTDEEIEAVSSRVTYTGKQEELASRLHMDAVHGQNDSFVGQLKQWKNTQAKKNCRETLQKALDEIGLAEPKLTDEEIEAVSSRVTSTGKQQELTSRLHIDAVHEQKDSFVGQLKQWRSTQTKTNCRDTLQKALEQIGLAGCLESIVGKITTKELDREELHRIALNLMMEDVRPFTDALRIDEEKVKSYAQQWDNQGTCTTGLLVNLQKESRNREGFCKALRNVGFIDIARSVFYGEKVSIAPLKP